MKVSEKEKLLTDVAIIREKITNLVDYIHEDMKPEVKKNSKFRIMVTGFVLISVPIFGIIMKVLG